MSVREWHILEADSIDDLADWSKCACEGHGTALAQRQRAIGTAAHPAASLTTAASA